MSDTNNTIKREENQYHHLKRDQRAQIEILVNEVNEKGKRIYSNADIAKKLIASVPYPLLLYLSSPIKIPRTALLLT